VVDRLGAGFLGPYGATWLDTPAFNQLAVESLLIEHALSDSSELWQVYRSYWTGRHAAMPAQDSPTLASLASAAGYQTCLLTDDRSVAEHPLAAGFQEKVMVPSRTAPQAAASFEETQLGRFFAAAAERMRTARPPFVLWVHAQGMQGLWDAPWDLRTQWSDEDDPQPPEFVEPPVRLLTGRLDPDELLGVMHAYAAQVTVLEECWKAFFGDFLDSRQARSTALVFTSPRGYPLGEHRRIGPVDGDLYGETLRVPLLLRFPEGLAAGHRAQAITQPADLFATLVDWLEAPGETADVWGRSLLPLAAGEGWPRDRAVAVHGGEQAIRTPAWFLRRAAEPAGEYGEGQESNGSRAELFVKPDDQWEINEVSDRLPDVVEELLGVLENFQSAVAANEETALAPLSDLLREGVA
jgi:arylsulfatase A-like enzyme